MECQETLAVEGKFVGSQRCGATISISLVSFLKILRINSPPGAVSRVGKEASQRWAWGRRVEDRAEKLVRAMRQLVYAAPTSLDWMSKGKVNGEGDGDGVESCVVLLLMPVQQVTCVQNQVMTSQGRSEKELRA